MAPKTLSELAAALVAKGRDGVAILLFLLWSFEFRTREWLHAEILGWKRAIGWGLAFSGWGI